MRATKHSKGGTPQVLLGRPIFQTAGFKLDYITNAFSFKVGNVEEIHHPKKPPALSKNFAHQVQLSKEDKDGGRQGDEAKERLKKGKGLRHSPPHVKKKKKDPMKKKVKIRKQGEESSREEREEEKEKRKLELKCKSVEDLIGKLYTFKKVLHHNDAMNHHLVKDQSKYVSKKGEHINGCVCTKLSPTKKNKKKEKNKEKEQNRELARPHDLKMPNFLSLEPPRVCAPLMVRPHASRARVMAPALKPNVISLSLSHFHSHFLSSSPNLSTPNLSYSHTNTQTSILVCDPRLPPIAKMDRKRKSIVAKGKGKLAMPPTWKSPRLAGLPPFLPPISPKSVLGPNKLLVLAIAAARVETRPKAQANIQAPVVEPPKDAKGKKTARIFVKPLRKRFSQRIIARGGPSWPKPKKVEVIDLISDEAEEAQEKEVAVEQPPLVANQEVLEDEDEDPNYEEEEDPEESVEPEETPSSWSLLSSFPATRELRPGEYGDPHKWNYDEDLEAQDLDSAEEEEEDRSTSSTSKD
ncbi:hypothetical protein PIB30_021983 [Stylosanthes scabra]|uniref:Uncharacterized protein n=1 Tax=Stylosanthes scabra TaxID=79078 RepID=A0ABU6WCJ6_9FABA|nr:hypothetical protein [Stylosanthes scabra]